eukprot:gene13600-18060_t
MHFVGMLAAPLPPDTGYLVLPTVVSYLICALVVGVSLFFVSGSRPGAFGVGLSATLLGAGICSMHYVGIHGLVGNFSIEHDGRMVLLSVLIAIATAYGALRILLSPQVGLRLAIGALAFGLAVSGMHYTAMAGMHFVPGGSGHDMAAMSAGLQASPQILSLIVACLCFMIAVGFLLFVLPDQWGQPEAPSALSPVAATVGDAKAAERLSSTSPAAPGHEPPAPGQELLASARVGRIPVQGAGATQFVDLDDVRSIRADAHYSWVHDGNRERMCSWPISEAEAALDPAVFFR